MNENSITTRLLDCIKKLSDAATEMLLTLALGMVDVESLPVTTCPYCGGKHIVRNGRKCGKQRFLCRSCGKTFVTTTHTLLYMSHSPAAIWKEVVSDTVSLSNGFPISGDSGIDADVFTGNSTFLCLCPMLSGTASNLLWKRTAFEAFQDKSLIQF